MVKVPEFSVVGGVIYGECNKCIIVLCRATTHEKARSVLEYLLTQSEKLQQFKNDGVVIGDEYTFLNQRLLSLGTYAINRCFQLLEK